MKITRISPKFGSVDSAIAKEFKMKPPSNKIFYQKPVKHNMIDEAMLLEGLVGAIKQFCEVGASEDFRPLYLGFLEFINESGKVNILLEEDFLANPIFVLDKYSEETLKWADKLFEDFENWLSCNGKYLGLILKTREDPSKNQKYSDLGFIVDVERKR